MRSILDGRYELVEPIGSGGMAQVWRGWSVGEGAFRRAVAVKLLLPNLADNEEFHAMFVEEARVISRLDHPNIVATVDFGSDDEGSYIVMELVEGVDLGRWILHYARREQKNTPWPLAAMITMNVLRALNAAHEGIGGTTEPSSVFHRDVTPSNILLSRHGAVKLSDFGLARAMDRITLTTPGVVKGKLAYVAPEIVGGTRCNQRTDLYSLGIVLWETLSMRRLFEGIAELELFVKVGEGKVPSLREERSDVPEGLHEVLGKLVAKHPEDRFESASAALAAFDAMMRDENEIVTADDLAQSVLRAG